MFDFFTPFPRHHQFRIFLWSIDLPLKRKSFESIKGNLLCVISLSKKNGHVINDQLKYKISTATATPIGARLKQDAIISKIEMQSLFSGHRNAFRINALPNMCHFSCDCHGWNRAWVKLHAVSKKATTTIREMRSDDIWMFLLLFLFTRRTLIHQPAYQWMNTWHTSAAPIPHGRNLDNKFWAWKIENRGDFLKDYDYHNRLQ